MQGDKKEEKKGYRMGYEQWFSEEKGNRLLQGSGLVFTIDINYHNPKLLTI